MFLNNQTIYIIKNSVNYLGIFGDFENYPFWITKKSPDF